MSLLEIHEPGETPLPHAGEGTLAVGIDLGTTNSVVAIAREGKPAALHDETGRALVPSVVAYPDAGGVLVGDEARALTAQQPKNVVASVKRLMGRGAADLHAVAGVLPYEIEPGTGETDMVKLRIGGKARSPVEISADYPISGPQPASALRQQVALTFVLGGLSKSVGLPQVKLGWIAAGGPPPLVADALERLETICDAYLSVSTPVQVAAPALLSAGGVIRTAIHERVRENAVCLSSLAASNPACAVMPVEAGWYAAVQVPAIASEETIVLDLLDKTGVLVHPGYFFDFEREAFLVVSLLPKPEIFAAGAEAIFTRAGVHV